ncbi:MAG: hypothetical protein CME59_18765 [Halioglobus sp.]|nr:hypothetical protein [Halioglobus sp.]|tara:strand:- start:1773 stop:2369 length:597 start_codon:yes stop_codon:yes gene_type:complete
MSVNRAKRPSRAATVDVILEAARACYLHEGIDATGMREVAARAGIARSTLYRYFPRRDDLLLAVMKEEMLAVNVSIQRRVQSFDDFPDQVVEGLLFAIRAINRRPLLRAVFVAAEAGRVRSVLWESADFLSFGDELMRYVIEPAQASGMLQDAVSADVLTEWIYRQLLSFLTLPSQRIRGEEELRATLHALLVPVLLQ